MLSPQSTARGTFGQSVGKAGGEGVEAHEDHDSWELIESGLGVHEERCDVLVVL